MNTQNTHSTGTLDLPRAGAHKKTPKDLENFLVALWRSLHTLEHEDDKSRTAFELLQKQIDALAKRNNVLPPHRVVLAAVNPEDLPNAFEPADILKKMDTLSVDFHLHDELLAILDIRKSVKACLLLLK